MKRFLGVSIMFAALGAFPVGAQTGTGEGVTTSRTTDVDRNDGFDMGWLGLLGLAGLAGLRRREHRHTVDDHRTTGTSRM